MDPDTWQIDPSRIEARVTPSTTVLLPVHILGGVCDMDRVGDLARRRGLRVVEDACEAHLAEWRGRKAGTLGDLGCFSFQTGKPLTCGEGGAILGRDGDLTDLCYSLHDFGRPHGRKKLLGYAKENECPVAERLCEETAGFHQSLLLGTREDMDDVVNAILELHESRAKLAS